MLNFMEVYEQNGSGLVFSNFVSLQLSLWHLDPLLASAFVPLPNWIHTRRAVVNIRGMHPVEANGDRMIQYTEHVGKYDFSSLYFHAPLSSVGSSATTDNMSINVYGVYDDKKVIYPLRVSSTLFPDRRVDLPLFERNGIQHHYTTIRNFRRLVSSQISNHEHTVYCCKQCLHANSTQELLNAHATE